MLENMNLVSCSEVFRIHIKSRVKNTRMLLLEFGVFPQMNGNVWPFGKAIVSKMPGVWMYLNPRVFYAQAEVMEPSGYGQWLECFLFL